MIPDTQIEAAKRTIDLVEYIRQDVPLKKIGSNLLRGRCPFPDHKDEHPSFTIYPDEGRWYCFGCKRGGDVIAYVQERDGLSFREALATLWTDRFPLQATKGWPLSEEEAWELLGARGVTKETALHFKLAVDLQKQAWVYPVSRLGKEPTMRCKAFRNDSGSKYWNTEKNAGPLVYNLDGIRGEEEIWLCEGEPDVWIMHQAGFPAIAFCAGAKYVPPNIARELEKAGVRTVHIIYDRDATGKEGARRVANELAKHFEVTIRALPDTLGEGGDLNDLYVLSPEDFGETVLSLADTFVKPPQTEWSWRELTAGDLVPIDWLVPGLIPHRSLALLVGDSGTGKSWAAVDLALSVASGKPFLQHFTTMSGPVCVVDEEGSVALLRRRVVKLRAAKEIPREADLPIQFYIGEGHLIDRQDKWETLLHKLEPHKPVLTIIDSLVRIHTADENDAGEMSQVMNLLRELQQALNTTLLVTHHARKRTMFANRPAERIRGSSDIRAAVDAVLYFTDVRGSSQTKQVDHAKSRYAEPIEPFRIEIVDNEEGAATYVRYAGQGEPIISARERAWEVIEATLAEEGPLPTPKIIKRCQQAKIGKNTVRDVLHLQEEEERVKSWREGRAKVWALAED